MTLRVIIPLTKTNNVMHRQFVIRELILDTKFKVIVRSFRKFLYPSVSQPEIILSHKGCVARFGGVCFIVTAGVSKLLLVSDC